MKRGPKDPVLWSDVGVPGGVPQLDSSKTVLRDHSRVKTVNGEKGDVVAGAVTSVSGTAPVTSTGGATPAIGMPAATSLVDGHLTSADWATFNGKQAALGFTAENVANKSTDTALGTSDTLYPSQKAVKTYADTMMPLAGGTFSGDIVVPAEAYGAGWNGSNEAPTKNDVYDKIETLSATKYKIAYYAVAGVTATTGGATSGSVNCNQGIPRTGTYKLVYTCRVLTVTGTPSILTIKTPAATSLDRWNTGAHTTLIAANTTIGSYNKGSTFAVDDWFQISSADLSLTEDDFIGNSAGAGFCVYTVNNATSIGFYAAISVEEQ